MNWENTVKNVVAEISMISNDEICNEDTLISLGINSLKSVELIVALEDALDITFAEEDLDPENLKTVKSIISLVELYLG